MEIVMDLLMMLGGVAVFMFGMKQMSSGLEQNAGAGIRNLFKKLNKNRAVDYGIGIGATAIVQSSSATSIMTVGLAHAGIVSIKQGAGIILGAKVGTTLTAFIFALSGISKGGFNISAVFAAIAFVGVMIVYATDKESLNRIAPFLIGFGMLFVGLEVMEFAIGGKDSILCTELSKVFRYSVMQNPILLVILGIVFTSIIQSSTAATGVFITFLATGVIHTVDQSFFLIMGANIGTCSDGIMASLSTNANGKRIALFHLLTSAIGALAFSVILAIFRTPIVNIFESLFPNNPEFSLATYNLIYNTIYTLVILVFISPLIDFVTKSIKDKKEEKTKLLYIDDHLLGTPSIAIDQALNEVNAIAVTAYDNLDRAFDSIVNEDMSQSKKIAEEEYRIDYVTDALANYFIKISSTSISLENEKLIGGLHHVITDIERMGDHAVLFVKETNYMKQQDVHFSYEAKNELKAMYNNISELYALCSEAFTTREAGNFEKISSIREKHMKMLAEARDQHIHRLNSNMCSVGVSKSFYSILFSMQRVADHIVNIGFSVSSTSDIKV